MKGKKLLVTLAAAAVLFAGCGLKSGNTIIKVNDRKITKAEFDKKLDQAIGGSMFARMGVDMKNGQNDFLLNILKQRVVNELIIKSLLDAEIEKRGIKVSNADVEAGVKEIIEKLGSKEQLDTILKQHGVSPAQFKRDIAEQVKLNKIASQLGDSSVSDAEAKSFYDKNIEKFKHPDQVRASHILIIANPKEIEAIIKSQNEGKTISEEEMKASGELTKCLSKLMMLTEAYPELKANENFMSLQNDLKETEDKISTMRQFYNDIVLRYNNAVQMIPSNIVASICKFKPEAFFEATEDEKVAPKVSF